MAKFVVYANFVIEAESADHANEEGTRLLLAGPDVEMIDIKAVPEYKEGMAVEIIMDGKPATQEDFAAFLKSHFAGFKKKE